MAEIIVTLTAREGWLVVESLDEQLAQLRTDYLEAGHNNDTIRRAYWSVARLRRKVARQSGY
jgi:hypothetical protein